MKLEAQSQLNVQNVLHNIQYVLHKDDERLDTPYDMTAS